MHERIDDMDIKYLEANEREADDLAVENKKLRDALGEINGIRNSIVAFQTVNWSEHIYPLVAVLNEAGIAGLPYPEAREHFGTLLERTNAAEAEAKRLREVLPELLRVAKWALNLVEEFHPNWTTLDGPKDVPAAQAIRDVITKAEAPHTGG